MSLGCKIAKPKIIPNGIVHFIAMSQNIRVACSDPFCANLTSATVWRITTCVKCGYIEFVNNLFDLEDCECCGRELSFPENLTSLLHLCGTCYFHYLERYNLLNEAYYCKYYEIESSDPAINWLSRTLDLPIILPIRNE